MLYILAAIVVSCLFFYLYREATSNLEKALLSKTNELQDMKLQNMELKTRLEEERRSSDEKIDLLMQAQEAMKTSFKALSSDALKWNQTTFFELAKETFDKYQIGMNHQMREKEVAIDGLMKPLRESLEKVDGKIQELEKSRIGAYAGITEQLKALASTQVQLHGETSNLVKALRMPNVRGKWGEIQLRRVVEMAGMVEHCDFVTQVSENADSGGRVRPDLIVTLPNERLIIVDAKTPLQAYLEAVECQDDLLRAQKLKDHARQLRRHLQQLGEKAYFEQFPKTPEFVVLFLPSESIFYMALEHDPSLIEYGVERKVLLATPTTLIALLRAVAYGWREEVVAEHAEKISELGRTLYDRLLTVVSHFQKLKRSLDSTCEAYNKVAGCFESRVLVTARQFQEMGIGDTKKELDSIETIEKITHIFSVDNSEI
ncbi:MAG: hypothetical protein JWO53_112 [Chlamydiia bacterium]|nr:hypothetical protein [Chlamydiia bacterium]